MREPFSFASATSELPTIRPEFTTPRLDERISLKSPFEKPHSASSLDNRWSTVYHHNQIEGGLSSMAKQAQQRIGLLQGTLDMLILRTLLHGPAHGHQIGKHIQRTTNEFLQMQHGSLYPALHRLERRGWVVSRWETAPDRNREFKYYRLTDKGRKQLLVEESQWKQMAEAVARVMWPSAEET
jgi:PadR family transcriptional regulator PadR